MQSVGLELHQLFPTKPSNDHAIRGERMPYLGADVLRALASEIILIVLQGAAAARGEALSEADRHLLLCSPRNAFWRLWSQREVGDRGAQGELGASKPK